MRTQDILKQIMRSNGVPQKHINIIDNYITLKDDTNKHLGYSNFIINTKDNYMILEHNGTMELRHDISKEDVNDLCNSFKKYLTDIE